MLSMIIMAALNSVGSSYGPEIDPSMLIRVEEMPTAYVDRVDSLGSNPTEGVTFRLVIDSKLKKSKYTGVCRLLLTGRLFL